MYTSASFINVTLFFFFKYLYYSVCIITVAVQKDLW